MSTSRIRLKYKEALNLNTILPTDSFGILINKLNQNFLEIINGGGGPMGPPGPIGPPGCRGTAGAPGKDGENVLDEWSSRIGIGCEMLEIHDLDDVIMNKHIGKTLLLSNISETDGILSIKQINDDEYTSPIISSDLSDYKVKIYNASDDGKYGRHIHLMNSKAVTIDSRFLCRSGFTIDLNLDNNQTERLRIVGQKNSNISGHKHITEIVSDNVEITREETSQVLRIDAGDGYSDYVGKLNQVTLTKDNIYDIPDRTGFVAILEDTLEHGETWEVISSDFIKLNYARYNQDNVDIPKEAEHWVFMDSNSEVRFKRINSFIVIDFHIGIRKLVDFDNFFIKNLQFKMNLKTLGARTIGWYPCSVLGSENFEDDDSFTDQGFFKVTPTDYNQNSVNDTFLISLKFKRNESLEFSHTKLTESYWFSGQIWSTELSEDPSCIQVTIDQDNVCPYLEITG